MNPIKSSHLGFILFVLQFSVRNDKRAFVRLSFFDRTKKSLYPGISVPPLEPGIVIPR
jgi:hypothetical protein